MKKNRDLYWNYVFEFILNLRLSHFIWPTYLIVKGYSLIDVGVCESVFHMTSMFGELPTGIISDLYGRRLSRLLSRILDLGSIILLVGGQHIVWICLSFVLSALSYNLESGTDSAYVYDLLLMEKHEKDFARVQGIREMIVQIAMILAIMIGGLCAECSYVLVYSVSFVLVCLSIYVLMQMREVKNKGYVKMNLGQGMLQQVKVCYEMLKKDRHLIVFILTYALFSAALAVVCYYMTNYWTQLGISLSRISFYLSLENVMGIFAGAIAYKVISYFSKKQLLLFLPLGIVVGMIGIPYYPFSIVSLCVMSFFEAVLYVAMTTYLNERVESRVRATLLSTMSMGYSIVMIVYFPVIGVIGHYSDLKLAFIILGLMSVVVYVIYGYMIRKIDFYDSSSM